MDFFGHAQLFEQGHVERQQGLADVKARVSGFLDQHDIASTLRKERRYRRPARTAANDQDIT